MYISDYFSFYHDCNVLTIEPKLLSLRKYKFDSISNVSKMFFNFVQFVIKIIY